MSGAPFAVLIPAYRPARSFTEFVRCLSDSVSCPIIVVDDGSGTEYSGCFEQIEKIRGVHLLRHAINLGKGAALKTGINHFLCKWPDLAGIITADADGQHAIGDVIRIAERLVEYPNSLILGARNFDASVPFRSRIGNKTTIGLARLLIGQRLTDTQTGLRGIPAALLPHLLQIASSGYEFELEMLITAKHLSYEIREEKVQTIYIDSNRASHFDPLFDSMRIYFVLLRFSILSLLTALVDNLVFFGALHFTGSIAQSQVVSRLIAILFNYTSARRVVFLSRQSHRIVLPRYLLLVLASGLLSYSLIRFFTSALEMNVLLAKPFAEGLIFIVNFAIQRDFVFTKREPVQKATDWKRYYTHVPFTARLTRKYTSAVLVNLLKKVIANGSDSVLVEIGGANSCFLEQIQKEIRPRRYYVIDTNDYGLGLLENRIAKGSVCLLCEDVLDLRTRIEADVVFSVGLIEHFEPADTRRAVLAHFDLLRPDGYAILSFPTPTLLYRIARGLCETAGLWKFPDERPLERDEVAQVVAEQGEVMYETILWPLVFTQRLLAVRKLPARVSNKTEAATSLL